MKIKAKHDAGSTSLRQAESCFADVSGAPVAQIAHADDTAAGALGVNVAIWVLTH